MSAFALYIAWQRGQVPAGYEQRLAERLQFKNAEPLCVLRQPDQIFLHRQLITAPEDVSARQPIRSGCWTLLFDGYLINREQLASELQLGPGAKALADCDYALAALEHWGEDLARHMLGDFALAAWNDADGQLLLARDAIGQRPLYYHQGDGFIACATSAAVLLALPEIPAVVDEERLADYLMDFPSDDRRSFHAAIARLPAASTAVFNQHRADVHCYWKPNPHVQLHYRRDEEYVEAARELLQQAVSASLRVFGPPVAAITGGLDSSAVAITAANLLPDTRLRTVTAVPEAGVALPPKQRDYMNERPFVEAIARQNLQLDPTFHSGSALHHWDENWAEMFLLTGMPLRNIMGITWTGPLRDHVVASGSRVLLSGGYGNLGFSWGGQEALPALFRSRHALRAIRETLALRDSNSSSLYAIWQHLLRPQLPVTLLRGVAALRGKTLRSPFFNSAIHPEFALMYKTELHQVQRHRLSNANGITQRLAHFHLLQNASDVVGLVRPLFGLEMRNPLADRRLLEFCFAVPEHQYLRGGTDRWLARRVMAGRLPTEVLSNTARGLQCPEFFHRMSLLRKVMAEGIEDLERSPLACRLLDVQRMKALLHAWPTGADTAREEYMTVLHRGLHMGQFLRWIESQAANSDRHSTSNTHLTGSHIPA